MARAPARHAPIARQIRLLFDGGSTGTLDDAELVRRVADRGDEAAFAALIERHGPMVLRVCRDLISDPDLAHDAFQAAFLILLRRARSIRERATLGPWLHGVARRVALRARSREARRLARVRRAEGGSNPRPEALCDDPARHLDLDALHAEIGKLPAIYRDPVVLCYLEGLTHDQAAARLGWPVGTVRGRLARARERLRHRLERRGLTPNLGPALAGLTLPESLIRSILSAAMSTGTAVPAAALATGVLKAMIVQKTGMVAMNLAAIGSIAWGATVMAPAGWGGDGPTPVAAVVSGPVTVSGEMVTKTYDVGDLLTSSVQVVGEPGPRRNFDAVIDVIVLSIAPGTWKVEPPPLVVHSSGVPVYSLPNVGKLGSIMPVDATSSLVIRHTSAVHEQVAERLRQLRELHGLPKVSPQTEARSIRVLAPQVGGDPEHWITVAYTVGDLVLPPGGKPNERADFEPLVELIRSNVSPESWAASDVPPANGQVANGSITPFYLNASLIIRQTPDVHDRVVQLLRQIRRLRGLRQLDEAEERRPFERGETAGLEPAPPAPVVQTVPVNLLGRLEDQDRRLIDSSVAN